MNVEQLAVETRALFDNRLVPRDKIGRLYEAYNPDLIDTREFLEAAEHTFPKFNCGLAAVYLVHQINHSAEIIRGAFNTQNHTYLKIGQRIVDITADQFGGPSVYVGSIRPPWRAT